MKHNGILVRVAALAAVAAHCVATLQAAEPAPSPRQYAPPRQVDMVHLALDLTPDFAQRTLEGQATLRFKALAQPVAELRLDAVNLTVHSVTATVPLLGWQATDEQVILTFTRPIGPGTEASVTIRYRAAPRRGLYFRTPELGYAAEDTHLFTQGESIDARCWFPCVDAPNDKFTTELICRVPEGMVALSNGRLVSSQKDPATGLVAFHWLQDKPHTSYLVALAAGYFKAVEDRYRDIPLAFYTPASQIGLAQRSFAGTAEMLAFFEQETGVPYPWAKYYQVCVQDFVAGGMENTSLTLLTDTTLHPPEFETLEESQDLVAHELAHQWFGNLVTCKDWAHLWLNEGFATYYELLYDGHKHGRDQLLYRAWESAKEILAQPDRTNAIVRRNYRHPDELFGVLTYPKAAWVLHMLRCQLGPELFRQGIRTFLERHAYGLAGTEDFQRVVEEVCGRSFDQFFDQWLYQGGHPELTVSYSWDERSRLARLSIRQTQATGPSGHLFQLPLPIRFKSKAGVLDHVVTVQAASEDFYVAVPWTPEIVRLDPDLTVLARIRFDPPTAMLRAQLADRDDMLGRLQALEQLAARGDRTAIPAIKQVLNTDSFWGVRVAASKALRALHTDEALEALLDSIRQADARVRRQLVEDIGGFHHDKACAALLKMVETESNPEIKAVAVRALGAWRTAQVRDKLAELLRSVSYRQVVAEAAIEAIQTQDDPSLLPTLHQHLQQQPSGWPASVFARGLEVLAWLARNEQNKDAIREFLISYTKHPSDRIRLAALRALGTLGDPKAVPVLERFAATSKANPEQAVAQNALTTVHQRQAPPAELSALRQQVADLQAQTRQLRQQLDDLKRRLEALASPARTAGTNGLKRLAPPRQR